MTASRPANKLGAMHPYAQPLTRYEATVVPEWIDYNGHMNLAYYVVVFDVAGDEMWEHMGIGRDFREASGYSSFVVETHTLYEREVKLDDRLCVFSYLLGADAKRVHVFHEMFHMDDGYRAATQELMALHVKLDTRRVTALPEARLAVLRTMISPAPRPPEAGRRIAMPG